MLVGSLACVIIRLCLHFVCSLSLYLRLGLGTSEMRREEMRKHKEKEKKTREKRKEETRNDKQRRGRSGYGLSAFTERERTLSQSVVCV